MSEAMTTQRDKSQYVACMSNEGYPVALVVRRIYRRLLDLDAEKEGLLRVVDESGEDYLYPSHLFLVVDLSQAIEKAFRKVS